MFLGLAETVGAKGAVTKRWEQMLKAEAEIIENQPRGSRMHSGV